MMPGPSPSPTNEPVDAKAGVANDVLQALNGPPDHLPDDLPDLLLQEFNPVADNPNPLPLNAQLPIPPDNDLHAAADLEVIQILLQKPLEPINLDDINLPPCLTIKIMSSSTHIPSPSRPRSLNQLPAFQQHPKHTLVTQS